MKVKEESEKVGLKLNIQKTQIMASGQGDTWECLETYLVVKTWGGRYWHVGDSAQGCC